MRCSTHSKFKKHLAATVESMELRRLLSTVTGTIYSDANRNGRLDAGEPGLAARTVFADYNYNGSPDASEPRAVTDSSGNYSLATRAQYVQLSLVTNAGEEITLGYGARSIWLPTVSGTVSGKNIGVIYTGPTTTISGFVYNDANANGQRDSGEVGFPNVILWFDLNDDAQWQVGEPLVSSAGDGSFVFDDVAQGTSYTIRAEKHPEAGVPFIFTEPVPWYDAVRTVVANGVRQDVNFGLTNVNTTQLFISVFRDFDQDGTHDADDRTIGLVDIWLDVNGDRLHDRAEPAIPWTNFSPHDPGRLTINLPFGTWNVAVRFADDNDQMADIYRTITASSVSQTLNIAVPPVGSVMSGVVFVDANENGARDDPPANIGSRFMFADYNENGVWESDEPYVTVSGGGFFQIEVGNRSGILRFLPTESVHQTLPAGVGYRFNFASTTTSTGNDFGIVQAQVSGKVFSDTNRNGRLDAGELGWQGRMVFADYNYNGIRDGAEPVAYTLFNGEFTLQTRDRHVSLRLIATPADEVTLGYGATSIWLPEVFGTVTDKNIGVALAETASQIRGVIYVDANGNSQRDPGELPHTGRLVYADYNYNGVPDDDEPQVITDALGNYALATRREGVELRVFYYLGEQITLGYGATSIWLPVVNGVVSGKDFGIARVDSLSDFASSRVVDGLTNDTEASSSVRGRAALAIFGDESSDRGDMANLPSSN